jgi:hypothetical protein
MIALLTDCSADPVDCLAERPTGQELAERQGLEEEDWQEDPVSVKWSKIRATFLNGKTAAEVRKEAEVMPVGTWLDWAIKMAPKDVKVSGEINIAQIVANLGPIDKEAYRFRPFRREAEA